MIGAVGVAAATDCASASHFGTWQPVYTTAALSVRDGAGTSYNHIDTALQGTNGQIIDGPVDSDGYTWWADDYWGNTSTGWSAQGSDWLLWDY